MAVITFNIALRDGKLDVGHGSVAWFDVAGQRTKFVLQHDRNGEPSDLTHYASGLIFGDLDRAKLRVQLRKRLGRVTPHEAAKLLISETVARHGAEAVLKRINEARIINH